MFSGKRSSAADEPRFSKPRQARSVIGRQAITRLPAARSPYGESNTGRIYSAKCCRCTRQSAHLVKGFSARDELLPTLYSSAVRGVIFENLIYE